MSRRRESPRTFFDRPAARLLQPLAWAYGSAAAWKRLWGTKRAQRLAVPVVSIGNITCGGTGKTPAVEMVARDLLQRGCKPAILSRGYGGPARTGEGAPSGNDELLVLRANLPEVPHFQSSDRAAVGREAAAAGADVLVLDDGFQHVRLHRDADFVLIDALAPFGHGRVLPAGLLREPLDALSLATVIGVTRSDQVAERTLRTLQCYLRRRFPHVPQVELATQPLEWVSLSGERLPPAALAGRRAVAFCGIGNPEAFRRQLAGLGVEVARFLRFRDHHAYGEDDIAAIDAARSGCGAGEVLMTQKDAVKLGQNERTAAWRHLKIATRVVVGDDIYQRVLGGIAIAARGRVRSHAS